jgi:hypothetical protein
LLDIYSEDQDITLEWLYKDKRYRCKYRSNFKISPDRGFNVLFGPNETFDVPSENSVNPFEDALRNGRLKKRNSWKNITKRKSFKTRQSSIRTDSSSQATSTAAPLLNRSDDNHQARVVPSTRESVKQQMYILPESRKDVLSVTNPSQASVSQAPSYVQYQHVPISESAKDRDIAGLSFTQSKPHESPGWPVRELPGVFFRKDSDRMLSGMGTDMPDLTEEVPQTSVTSVGPSVPMIRFLNSALEPGEQECATVTREHSIQMGAHELAEENMSCREQFASLELQEEVHPAESPADRHREDAPVTKQARFPDDYWLWDDTAKRYYHRDEDTDSIAWYGPLD